MTNPSKLFVGLMSVPFRAGARVILLAALLATPGGFAPNVAPNASANSQTIQVERLLNPDGTLNLNNGFSGALDLSGWQVTLDSQRGPILARQNGVVPAATNGSTILRGSAPRGMQLGVPQPVPFWMPLPNNGLSGIVYAIAVSGSDVYVGGNFTATADGAVPNLNYIAKFSGGAWSALPHNGLNGFVYAFAVSGSDLYVGGDFDQTADGAVTHLRKIARFSVGAWSALPNNGLNTLVSALAVSGGDLYVGGHFSQTADGAVTNLNSIARFSGGAWSALPHTGLNDGVGALAVIGSDLYVGGIFTGTADCFASPLTCVKDLNGIARFSGGAWSALPNKGVGAVYAFAVSGSDLYVGGSFIQTHDCYDIPQITCVKNLNNVAKFSGGAWSALPNNGLFNTVYALAVSGSDLYVGGAFLQTADGAVTNLWHIAKFSGGTWSALPHLGLNDFVYALAAGGNDLYAGGIFNATADGAVTPMFHIAKLTNDTDGDGIPDDWERNGVTINGVFIDLPAMGADPLHKDLFIHADWMNLAGLKPDARDLQIVSDAFAYAPLPNPDGTTGVRLHVDLGPDSVMNPVTGATWGALSKAGALPYQATIGSTAGGAYNWNAVDTLKQTYFNPWQRAAVFHYMCFCSSLGGLGTTSGISRGIPGHDFLVTLGGWSMVGGTSLQKAGTFMHELGHNLGLRHGGGDNVNFKPNFLSVMNYSFQITGLLTPSGNHILRTFDYSRRQLPTLDETALVESAGIGDPGGHITFWNTQQPDVGCAASPDNYFNLLANPAPDWNCDGELTAGTLQADINGDGVCVGPGPNAVGNTIPAGDDVTILGGYITAGLNRKCDTTKAGDDDQLHPVGFQQPNQLTSFDDWSAVVFDEGGQIGQPPAAPAGTSPLALSDVLITTVDEPTYQQIKDAVPPVLFDAETTAPIDVVSYSPANGSAHLVVSFDGSASTTPTGTISSWAWDFGDNTVGSGATITHTYSVPGVYFATLRVTNSNGDVNLVALQHRVTVTAGGKLFLPLIMR